MKLYRVNYTVDHKSGYSMTVYAENSSAARREALGSLKGRAGYAEKYIQVTSATEIRQ